MNKKIKSTLLILVVLGTFGCTSDKASENKSNMSNVVIGDWDVQWITSPDKGMNTDSINLTMNGKMLIKNDNQITIEAYGYKGCIFGTDTLIHTLNWEVKGDTLNLKNPNDVFGIPYIIKESSDKKIKLQLLEDVFLFLTKS